MAPYRTHLQVAPQKQDPPRWVPPTGGSLQVAPYRTHLGGSHLQVAPYRTHLQVGPTVTHLASMTLAFHASLLQNRAGYDLFQVKTCFNRRYSFFFSSMAPEVLLREGVGHEEDDGVPFFNLAKTF